MADHCTCWVPPATAAKNYADCPCPVQPVTHPGWGPGQGGGGPAGGGGEAVKARAQGTMQQGTPTTRCMGSGGEASKRHAAAWRGAARHGTRHNGSTWYGTARDTRNGTARRRVGLNAALIQPVHQYRGASTALGPESWTLPVRVVVCFLPYGGVCQEENTTLAGGLTLSARQRPRGAWLGRARPTDGEGTDSSKCICSRTEKGGGGWRVEGGEGWRKGVAPVRMRTCGRSWTRPPTSSATRWACPERQGGDAHAHAGHEAADGIPPRPPPPLPEAAQSWSHLGHTHYLHAPAGGGFAAGAHPLAGCRAPAPATHQA